MQLSLRVAVTGLAATYPLGGVFWDYLQYVLGLSRMGVDVLYIEDTGSWAYSPGERTFVPSGRENARFLEHHLTRLEPGLANSWFYRDATGETYGRSWPEVVSFCRSTDLFLHISASCWMRDEYRAAKVCAFVDTDPMYTQASIPDFVAGRCEDVAAARVRSLLEHDVHFTFAERIGAPDCSVPQGPLAWIPTRQPIVLDQFRGSRRPPSHRRSVLTTVASWETKQGGPLVDGVQYFGKNAEFERYLAMPSRSPMPVEVAMSGPAPLDRLGSHGWHVIDALTVSHDPWVYRSYLAESAAEFSIAKHAYVASRSGWLSCRTACYLASGVPAVVQDTGLSEILPTGEGLLAFSSHEEAAEGLRQVTSHLERHSRAAAELAETYLDSDVILFQLVDRATRARYGHRSSLTSHAGQSTTASEEEASIHR